MQTRHYDFILEAVTPIAHHSGTQGNEQVAMREKRRQPDGSFADVPIITGDTMRHGLKETASYMTLRAAGLLGGGEGLSEGALRLLFSGGALGGKGNGATIKLDDYRRMCDLFPPLKLFGGAVNSRIIPGQLEVGRAELICVETAHLLPTHTIAMALGGDARLQSCRRHVERAQRVRMDPMLRPEMHGLLDSDSARHVQTRLLAREQAGVDGDLRAATENKSSMLPFAYEQVAAGSLFSWSVTCRTYSDLEDATLHLMLAGFLSDCRVGGKRGTGSGRLRVWSRAGETAAFNVHVEPAQFKYDTINPAGIALNARDLYAAHMAERADALRDWLRTVDA